MTVLLTRTLLAVLPPAQDLPDVAKDKNNLILYGGAAAAVVVVLLVLVALRRGRRRGGPESGLAENLATYPPPPKAGDYLVTVMTQPSRLRLVVLAPIGKKPLGAPETVLEEVVRSLGDAAVDDKPRIRTWPAQLSKQGFAPTFFRLTKRPDPEGKPSRWVLLAGPARAGATPVLLGLAVLLDTPSRLGLMTMDELQWPEVLRVQTR
jgi:hypothetical protein